MIHIRDGWGSRRLNIYTLNPKPTPYTQYDVAGVVSGAPRALPAPGQSLEAANAGGMRLVLVCSNPDKVIVGIRILTGSSGPLHAPKEVLTSHDSRNPSGSCEN